MRVLAITGARKYQHPTVVLEALTTWLGDFDPGRCLLVHGDCREGVDLWAKTWARNNAVHHAAVEALWTAHRRAAGPRRNIILASMAAAFDADCYAFWDGKREGSGTMHAAEQFEKGGLELRLWGPMGTELIR